MISIRPATIDDVTALTEIYNERRFPQGGN